MDETWGILVAALWCKFRVGNNREAALHPLEVYRELPKEFQGIWTFLLSSSLRARASSADPAMQKLLEVDVQWERP